VGGADSSHVYERVGLGQLGVASRRLSSDKQQLANIIGDTTL
jgi:hypothetical protein